MPSLPTPTTRIPGPDVTGAGIPDDERGSALIQCLSRGSSSSREDTLHARAAPLPSSYVHPGASSCTRGAPHGAKCTQTGLAPQQVFLLECTVSRILISAHAAAAGGSGSAGSAGAGSAGADDSLLLVPTTSISSPRGCKVATGGGG